MREAVPRGFVKRLVFGVVTGNEKLVRRTLERAATSPRTVLQVLELAARLNKGTGATTDVGSGTTVINFHTNVDMFKLRAASVRATKPVPAPALTAQAPARTERSDGVGG